MDTMNDRYNLHKDKFEKFSSAEIMEALNEFFSNPKWRDEKRFVITSKFGVTRDYGIGFKRVDLAADWAIDSAIRYLREEFGIFYAPDTVDKDDEYRKQDIKCTNDCYTSNLTKEIVRLEKEVHDECVRADYWFKTARARLDEIEKLKNVRDIINGKLKEDRRRVNELYKKIVRKHDPDYCDPETLPMTALCALIHDEVVEKDLRLNSYNAEMCIKERELYELKEKFEKLERFHDKIIAAFDYPITTDMDVFREIERLKYMALFCPTPEKKKVNDGCPEQAEYENN